MPAYFADRVEAFLHIPADDIKLRLVEAYQSDRYNDLITTQMDAWDGEIDVLKSALLSSQLAGFKTADWGIALEFVIPRRMGRIDAVFLIGGAIVVLEFKGRIVDGNAAYQVEDYCLDLLHFHQPSHGKVLYPVVVGAKGAALPSRKSQVYGEIQRTSFIDVDGIADLLAHVAVKHSSADQPAISEWNLGEYRPVPTIVEAAVAMFAQMQVEDIAKAGCDPINLNATVDTIKALVRDAAQSCSKTICFVTGVPGAGKTLAGLKLVHDEELRTATGSDSVFLTGNLPLVKVLQTALARDAAYRRKQNLRVSSRDPKTTIDTVLGYKKTYTKHPNAPHENIVVFDEAQRAWDAIKTAKYLEGATDWVGYSEPELMLSVLDRQPWAVLVALVGGGQEINSGEAGLAEWGRALTSKFPHWSVAVSKEALTGEYGAGAKLFEGGTPGNLDVVVRPGLHLDNPTRQFRGKSIALWAEALLRGDSVECRRVLAENPDYSIMLTRDLTIAKSWMRTIARGTERFGCIASSGAPRLRAEGLEVPPPRADGVEHWFLNTNGDVRSSFQLEVAATEFQIQGLEIDWSCVCWGGDFLRNGQQWELKQFRGTKWQRIGNGETRAYVVNSYRVLLTRARQGMVIFVPTGDPNDTTHSPAMYEETASFLVDCGAQLLALACSAGA